jgi:tellurite resistance protein TehA-like permease
MAVMVVSNAIAVYYFKLGEIISFIAIIFHLYFFANFIYYRSKNFKFAHILPSWFIPPIGLVLAVITYPGGLGPVFAEQLLDFAFIAYALLLPIVLCRLFFSEKLTEGEKPFIVILATPASLLLACYFAIVTQPNYLFVWGLALLAILMTFFVYLAFIKLLRLPFTPAYSAFTFPLVIGAIALFKSSQFLLKEGFPMPLVAFIEQLANIELIIATLIVLYVSFRFVLHFSQTKKNNAVSYLGNSKRNEN